MMTKRYLVHITPLLAVLLLLLTAAPAAGKGAPAALRRFAFIAGANNGGPGRVALRYAHTDARSLGRVLRQLGGVRPGDLSLLLEPNRASLMRQIEQLGRRLRQARKGGGRLELLFYYSGHSDEQGLLLGGERVPYRQLRQSLKKLSTDVTIAVLDSCASGAMTRGKGGKRRPPFLSDRSTNVRGHAYLTSASATETAQESDRIKGSFFTHYLISGLRGAADVDHNGRVTLNEAYQHAFHETLARTESTRSGPQHPNYDMRLAGSGDLVITDLRGTTALLTLAPELDGRLFIRDRRGRLVAEIAKAPGKPASLGLEPGTYRLSLQQDNVVRRGTVRLKRQRRTLVRAGMLALMVAREDTRGRGLLPVLSKTSEHGPVLHKPVSISLFPGLSTNASASTPVLNNFAFHWLWDSGAFLEGMDLAMVGALRTHDARGFQLSGGFNHVGRDMYGFQISMVYNGALGLAKGLQLSGGVNWSGPMTGMQFAGALNVSQGDSAGLRIATGVDIVAGEFSGLQLAGALDWSGPLRGAQLTVGLAVVSGDAVGLQLGSVNVVTDSLSGAQLAAGVNVAAQAHGVQLSSINVASQRLSGAQIGFVNIGGKSRGLQLGIINIATEDDGLVPIGLLNYVGDGRLATQVWSSGSSLFNVGLEMGGKRVQGLLGVGVHPGGDEHKRFSFYFGLGTQLALPGPFWIDLDLLTHLLNARYQLQSDSDWLSQLRLALGYRLLPELSLYAGPTLDLLTSKVRQDTGHVLSLWRHSTADQLNLELGIGFVAGLEITPQWGRLNRR